MTDTAASHPALSFAERLRAGEAFVGGWFSLPEVHFAEAVAASPVSPIVLDVQHGLHDVASIVSCVTAIAAAGKPALVRVSVGDFVLAARSLDVGAVGVIAPMIDTAEQARAFAEQVKYPPRGRRSWGAGRAMSVLGGVEPPTYLREANDRTLALAMIETREAVEAVEEILAVDGIDGVFVGPNDLCIALTDGDRADTRDPILNAALDRIVATARAAGKIAGIFGGPAERAAAFRAKGFSFVTVGWDQMYVAAGIAAMLDEMEKTATSAGGSPGRTSD
ncbi:HpcH/HpaI aldolase family protein [Pinisolibacter sp.]|uniref:HpcH/HpaI aldolase family protein n=1 Tax=Pinisolibacter sp. TaxID=2172024 RepID=UPI002FDECC29